MTLTIRPIRDEGERNACFRLRHRVFVEEQDVPVELELDEHDLTDCEHFAGFEDGLLVATGRLVPYGSFLKLGRLAVAREARGKSFGRDLVTAMVKAARGRADGVVLDAQTHALGFYEALGFKAEGEVFDDAGIPHRRMRLTF